MLRVVTLNIHKGLSHFNRRVVIHDLREGLRALQPDVVFLQEVAGLNQRHALRYAAWPVEGQHEFLAGGELEHAYGRNRVHQHGHYGNALLSRFPMRKVTSIDLSVSAVLALGAVIVVQTQAGNSLGIAFLEAFAIAALIGLANGFLITKRQVPPFIATFGMLVFVQGARLAYTKGQASGTVPPILRAMSFQNVGPVPAALLVWIAINIIFIVVLRYTRFGRWIFASREKDPT
jgi:hypothetical protein